MQIACREKWELLSFVFYYMTCAFAIYFIDTWTRHFNFNRRHSFCTHTVIAISLYIFTSFFILNKRFWGEKYLYEKFFKICYSIFITVSEIAVNYLWQISSLNYCSLFLQTYIFFDNLHFFKTVIKLNFLTLRSKFWNYRQNCTIKNKWNTHEYGWNE